MNTQPLGLVARARRAPVGALLLAATVFVVIVTSTLFAGSPRARAVGLDFGCRPATPAELGFTTELKEYPKFVSARPVESVDDKTALPPEDLLTFAATGTDENGDPFVFTTPEGEATTKLDLVVPITKPQSLAPTPPIAEQMYDIDFNDDGVTDVSFAPQPRLSSFASRIDALLTESFGVTPDLAIPFFGTNVPAHSLAGVDFLVVKPATGIVDTMSGLSVTVGLSRPVDATTRNDVEATISNLNSPAPNDWPDTSRVTIGSKGVTENFFPNDGYVLGAVEHAWTDAQGAPAPETYRPEVIDTIEIVTRSYDTEDVTEENVFRATLGWSKAPQPFAAGMYSVCDPMHAEDSRTQISWNTAVTDFSPGTTFDLDVVTGAGQGIDGKDEVVVDTTFTGMPARLDMTFRPEALHIARSTDAATDLALHALQIARADDDEETVEQPFRVVDSGIDGLPEHSYLVTQYETVDEKRRLDRIGLEFCPEDAAMLPADEPLVPCSGASPPAPSEVRIDARDFFDGAETGDLPLDVPPGPESYVVYGSRDHAGCADCPSQFRAAARVADVRRVGVDLMHDEGFLGENGLDVDVLLGSPQSLDVVLHFDTRDDAGHGKVVDVAPSLSEIPAGALRVSQHDDALRPFMLRTELPGIVESLDATFNSRAAGGDEREVRGHAHATIVPQTLTFDWMATTPATGERNRLSYSASQPTDVAFDLETTTAADRDAGERIAVSGTAQLPGGKTGNSLTAEWRKTPAGALDEILASGCAGLTEGVCANGLDAVVRHDDAYDADEVAPAVLPAIPDDAFGDDGRHPEFTEWSAGEGVRAIFRPGDESWGVHASVRNLRAVRWATDPNVAELRTDATGQAFVVNVYDDRYADLTSPEDLALVEQIGTTSRELFVDATLSSLPSFLGFRLDPESDENPTRVWVTTDPAREGELDFDEQTIEGGYPDEEPGTEVLQGVIRIGDRKTLTDQWQGDWMRRERNTGDARGIDGQLWVRGADEVALGAPVGGTDLVFNTLRWALDVWANEPVPRNLFVEIPAAASCSASEGPEAYASCQHSPIFEPDETEAFEAWFITSSPDLGRLWFEAGFGELVAERVTNPCAFDALGAPLSTGLSKPKRLVRADVSRVPGELKLEVDYRSNQRLPWHDAVLELDAEAGIPLVTVDVESPADPAFYRVADDVMNDASYVRTDAYKVRLENVPTELDVDGHVALADGPHAPEDLTEETEGCPAPEGLAFVHAIVDLDSTATEVTLNTHVREDDRTVAELRARNDDEEPVPVSGELRFRKDGVGKEKSEFKPAPVVIDFLFIHFLGPLGLLFDGDVDFDADVHLDVPLRLTFTDTADLRFGNNVVTFGVDISDTPEAGAELAVQQTHMPGEFPPEIVVDTAGVYFHRQDVVMDGPFWQYRDEHREHEFADIGLYRWDECAQSDGWDDGRVCYWNDEATSLNTTDVTLHPNTSGDARTDAGLATHDIVLDPFWQEGSRRNFFDRYDTSDANLDHMHVGSTFYKTLTKGSKPVLDDDFDMPNLEAAQAPSASDVLTVNPQNDDCWATDDAYGADGGHYEVRQHCDIDEAFDSHSIVLGAYYDGANDFITRWRVRLPVPVGLGGNADYDCIVDPACRLNVRIDPQATGVVKVRVTTVRETVQGEDPIGGYEAWYDPSGNPAGPFAEGAADPAVYAIWDGYAPAIAPPEVLGGSTEEPVEFAPACLGVGEWWCDPPADDVRRVWFTGDGQRVDGGVLVHQYGLPGTYASLLVEYDPAGQIVQVRWFTVDVS